MAYRGDLSARGGSATFETQPNTTTTTTTTTNHNNIHDDNNRHDDKHKRTTTNNKHTNKPPCRPWKLAKAALSTRLGRSCRSVVGWQAGRLAGVHMGASGQSGTCRCI